MKYNFHLKCTGVLTVVLYGPRGYCISDLETGATAAWKKESRLAECRGRNVVYGDVKG
jgi:hypothetical protein